MSSKRKIAVIGAGASGLTSIKSCLEADLEPVCYERSHDIGGLWRYEENEKNGAAVYKSTYVNTSKEMMSFSDFQMPKEWPNILHNSKIQHYFNMYAERFDLLKYIKFKIEVVSCKKSDFFEKNGHWIVTTKCLVSGDVISEEFNGVLVCVGHLAVPHFPLNSFPGIIKFEGSIIHSHSYRTYHEYIGKNVLVIGMGNSGTDIAVELSWHAKRVFLSTRKGSWVFNRVSTRGLPIDFLVNTRFNRLKAKWMPQVITNYLKEAKLNNKIDHTLYGLKPEHRAYQQAPIINDDLPNRILNGSIKIKTNIKEFESDKAYFVDGTIEKIDAVIFATGYVMEFPFLEDSILRIRDNECDLYKYMWPVSVNKNTLAVIGHVQPLGTTTIISEIQSRWAVRVIQGEHFLPATNVMLDNVKRVRASQQKKYYASPRHTIQVNQIEYMDDIASHICAKPNIFKIFLTDYKLAKKMFFEGCTAYQYRLTGPDITNEARELILTQYDRVIKPLKTRKTPEDTPLKKTTPFLYVSVLMILAGIMFLYTQVP